MPPRQPNRTSIAIVLACLAPIALGLVAASFTWDVEAMANGAPWRLFGLQPATCPGCAACGLSRAFAAVSHGRWREAIEFNPSVVALYPGTWLAAIAGAVAAARLLGSRRA